jgi:flagellar basal-body rod protein FlgG
MNAVQQKLDIIARNVANVNTYGYKKRDASFEDLLTSMVRQHKDHILPGRVTPPGFILGNGSRVNEISMHARQGSVIPTNNPTDLAIIGDGFFEVELNEDTITNAQGNEVPRAAYTRDGTFKLTPNPNNPGFNYLTTSDGRFVRDVKNQRIQIPADAGMAIDQKGNVSVMFRDGQGKVDIAQIKIVRVNRPKMLDNIGDNLYTFPKTLDPNDPLLVELVKFDSPVANAVVVEQGYLEASNVVLSEEMTDLITTQRAFQLLARSLSQSDQMMGMVNNLRA